MHAGWWWRFVLVPVLALWLGGGLGAAHGAAPVEVGSKRFTESYVLGALVGEQLRQAGVPAQHRAGRGNTAVMVEALRQGAIDLYPEYTGTIAREVLQLPAGEATAALPELNRRLAPLGLKAAVPLGFDNSYALALRERDAARLGIVSIGDLARHGAALRPGFSHEFLTRADGWPALRQAYALPWRTPTGLDHGLAYQALAQGQIDVIDVYTTDAQIATLQLRVLRDEHGFFPRYDAVLLMRATLDDRVLAALMPLTGRIDVAAMRAMNAAVEDAGQPFDAVARQFLAGAAPPAAARPGFITRLLAPDLPRLLREHLGLVFASLAAALLVGVPLGLAAFVWPRYSALLMALVGMLQPVPSLALLVFLIALLGRIGFVPAWLALTVYALLPIVRNTEAGLHSVRGAQREAALALGLTPRQTLWHVLLPQALPTLMAGVKTAAVLNVGTATVATFIGAGGLGERIVAGLAVNDTAWMLSGAVPAALLAWLTQWAFDRLEARWQPPRP